MYNLALAFIGLSFGGCLVRLVVRRSPTATAHQSLTFGLLAIAAAILACVPLNRTPW